MHQKPGPAPIPIRVVAVGDGAVGKTCLPLAFKSRPFQKDYEPTIFENHHELRKYHGHEYCLHIWDTAGQQEYDRLRPMSYRKCDVVLICFALDARETLNNVTAKWIVEIKEYCPRAAIVLVGTKSDVWNPNAEEHVKPDEIQRAEIATNAYRYIACSAKKNENIGKVFDLAIKAVVHKNPKGCNVA
jgi:small GTP-binding protein